jgi:hypothetical protein
MHSQGTALGSCSSCCFTWLVVMLSTCITSCAADCCARAPVRCVRAAGSNRYGTLIQPGSDAVVNCLLWNAYNTALPEDWTPPCSGTMAVVLIPCSAAGIAAQPTLAQIKVDSSPIACICSAVSAIHKDPYLPPAICHKSQQVCCIHQYLFVSAAPWLQVVRTFLPAQLASLLVCVLCFGCSHERLRRDLRQCKKGSASSMRCAATKPLRSSPGMCTDNAT